MPPRITPPDQLADGNRLANPWRTMIDLLLSLYPGLFRIAAMVTLLCAAALAGAWTMAQKIACDEWAADERAENLTEPRNEP